MKIVFGFLLKLFSVIYFILLFPFTALTQTINISEFQYLSPEPGSEMNSPSTNIIIRYGKTLSACGIDNNVINITGDKSGVHPGEIILAEDNRTILFKPDTWFTESEIVTVKLSRKLQTVDNISVPELSYKFKITENDLNNISKNDFQSYYRQTCPEFFENYSIENKFPVYSSMGINDSLPQNFPQIVVDSLNNPAPGCLFFTPFTSTTFSGTYLIITDNYGTPVFYRKMSAQTFDFKKQPDGSLTYFDLGRAKFFVMDSSYNIIDSVSTGNGYVTDVHELLITENKHYLLMSYDNQYVRMDTIIDGGNPNAIVTGLIIQELDEDKNVVFQWRSWDHFHITDATNDINLRGSYIDYVHGNAIEVDNDGNLLISSRHMDEVTKINRLTGDIIWRLGGVYCNNNQFRFFRDQTGFSHQHDIRRLPNGHITVFDNGNLHNPPYSRAVEYQIDEINKQAILIEQYHNSPQTYSFAMGCVRTLDDHRVIGWGWRNTPPSITEIDETGDIALRLILPDTLQNYRAFKFPWKTNLFFGDPDSLNFGTVTIGDTLTRSLNIVNNSSRSIVINSLYSRDSSFRSSTQLPIIIHSFETSNISVMFIPDYKKNYNDELHIRWESDFQRIACVVKLSGAGDNPVYSNQDNSEFKFELNQNYPNPFNPVTAINYSIKEGGLVSLKIYNVLGKEIKTLVNEEKPAGTYEINFDASQLPSGIYFYKLQAGIPSAGSGQGFVETKKMILLK